MGFSRLAAAEIVLGMRPGNGKNGGGDSPNRLAFPALKSSKDPLCGQEVWLQVGGAVLECLGFCQGLPRVGLHGSDVEGSF